MLTNDFQYRELLTAIKDRIRSSQIKTALSVNAAVIQLYWNIGEMIANKQAFFEGKNNYIEQLASDIQSAFPDLSGFSKRNLFEIRRFYLFYSSISIQQVAALTTADNQAVNSIQRQIAALNSIDNQLLSVRQAAAVGSSDNQPLSSVQQAAALTSSDNQSVILLHRFITMIPWGHHLLILNKVKDPEQALFYIQQTAEYNWSRAVLTLQIEQNLFARQGKAFNNFQKTLPELQALMAQQMLKDPYNFGFLTSANTFLSRPHM